MALLSFVPFQSTGIKIQKIKSLFLLISPRSYMFIDSAVYMVNRG